MLRGKKITGVLVLVIFALFFATTLGGEAFAANGSGYTTFSVNAGDSSVLEVSVPADPITLELSPTATGGAYAETTINVTVGSNQSSGYYGFIKAIASDQYCEGYCGRLYYDNSVNDTDESKYIEGMCADCAEVFSNSLPTNKWGIMQLDGPDIHNAEWTGCQYERAAYPNGATCADGEIFVTSSTAGTSMGRVKFGANIDSSKASGVYKTGLEFVVVAKGLTSRSVTMEQAFAAAGKSKVTVGGSSYYKMQDMETRICDAVTVKDTQTQLVDTRDNQIYWVSKLKNNTCMMTQNLAFAINKSTITNGLTHEDTDLGYVSGTSNTWYPNDVTGYRVPSLQGTSMENIWPQFSSDTGLAMASFDSGTYYESVYSSDTYGTEPLYFTDTWYDSSVCSGNSCNGYHDDYSYNSKFKYSTPYSGNGEHGKVGAFYNRAAGIGVTHMYTYPAADTSVCPAHWRLPTQSEWNSILSNYSISSDYSKMEQAPLYFTRSGNVRGDGVMEFVGRYGGYLMRESYVFRYTSSSAGASNQGNPVYNGYNVRCVAR